MAGQSIGDSVLNSFTVLSFKIELLEEPVPLGKTASGALQETQLL